MHSHLTSLQGGFAHCYELIDMEDNHIYAGKIVPKSMLTKPHQRDKVDPGVVLGGFLGVPSRGMYCSDLAALAEACGRECVFR